jgi:hypothetical protein
MIVMNAASAQAMVMTMWSVQKREVKSFIYNSMKYCGNENASP